MAVIANNGATGRPPDAAVERGMAMLWPTADCNPELQSVRKQLRNDRSHPIASMFASLRSETRSSSGVSDRIHISTLFLYQREEEIDGIAYDKQRGALTM